MIIRFTDFMASARCNVLFGRVEGLKHIQIFWQVFTVDCKTDATISNQGLKVQFISLYKEPYLDTTMLHPGNRNESGSKLSVPNPVKHRSALSPHYKPTRQERN